MTGQDRAARVRRLFDELVGLGAGERDTRLTEECGSDEALRREVESLLAAAETGASDVGHALRSLRPRPEDDRDEPAFAGDHPPAALRAALEDRYVVEAEIGRGGMATVYRAHDRKHNRRVALKVLTPELAAVLGHGRFLREIETTANLTHPHILPLYDSGEAGGFLFYVMPLVDGESLRDRIEREGELPVDDAVRVASEVAGALQAAHEHGVIHRDIKPGNILLGRGGALVADFGIALAVGAASGRLTRTGITPGTPTYLSPEQLTGDQPAGPRSDIYALGCVLYEMLAGEPPFGSLRSPTVLAKVLTEEAPRLAAMRKSVPANVDAVVARSLEKLPADRFASAADFATALGRPEFRHPDTPAAAARMNSEGGNRNRRRLERAAWLALTMVLAGVAARGRLRGDPDGTKSMVVRTSLDLHGLQEIHGDVIISPDGSRLAVSAVVDGRRAIWTRRLDEPGFRPIPGTENGFTPAFSPDGAWVVFRKEVPGQTWLPPGASSPRRQPRGALVKADVSGAGAITLVDDPEDFPHYPYWSEDGTILYFSVGANLISATGSNPRRLRGAGYHMQLLPGGHAIVGSSMIRPGIQYVDLDTDSSWVVVPDGLHPKYIDSGFLLFARVSGGLYAVPFDAERGRTTGDPIRLVDRLAFAGQDRAGYAISRNGTLVYREGIGCCGLREAFDRFVRFDAAGKADTVRVPHQHLGPVRFSPDGRSIVYVSSGSTHQIHTFDLTTGVTARIASDGNPDSPVWSPDGTRIAWTSIRAETNSYGIYTKPVTGNAAPRLVYSEGWLYPKHWTSTDLILFDRFLGAGYFDVWTVPADGGALTTDPTGRDSTGLDRAARPWLEAAWDQMDTRISPDGTLAAYVSSETGRRQIVVQAFPQAGRIWRVSKADTAYSPRWAADGRSLYFWVLSDTSPDTLFQARIHRNGPDLRIDTPEPVLTISVAGGIRNDGVWWDVDPSSGGFVVAVTEDLTGGRPNAGDERRYVIVQNWLTELKERLEQARR